MASPTSPRTGRYIIAGLVLLLIVLHHDYWNWDNRNVVFGYIPVTLFYQVCISVGASATWWLATKIAWPAEIVEEAAHAKADEQGGRS